ncbi:hypothetical protein [Sandaracinus amylolyticus]|uniref:hypothetical protein n=1 Tax=Sandaracinus amylolyticus TaxID=927083 RepID=UPI001F334A54|nr:hypothetical protein [Sandaracinus amylolyticus]UJR81066.1 Hypothetical protein I5071_31170 [Sandaracinus amylolyticus]
MRISNSFSEGEIQVMDFILTTLLRGGTPNMAVRSKDFASLCRKVQSMKSRAADVKSGAPVKRGEPTQSSVGVIGAADESVDEGAEDLRDVG